MEKTIKTRSGRAIVLPTSEENTAINAGIAADPDTYEVSDEAFQQLRPMGRPRIANPKVPLTMRIDVDVLAALRSSGQGWQTRVNAILRDAVASGRL